MALIFLFVFWAIFLISWLVNLYKLLTCDFVAPYREEFIHTFGLIPFVSIITAWM
jgi:hypothetical protein